MAQDDARERARAYATPGATEKEAQTQAYMLMSDQELFAIARVNLSLAPEDLPGHPVSRVTCDRCGEGVNDRREVGVDNLTLCRACAEGAYYLPAISLIGPETRATLPVVAIVGNSNSGKTRVAASLVKTLSGQGYRIAAIKHCPHGHDPGRPDSDSDRLFRAGAITVIASSPDRRTVTERVDHDGSLTSLVSGIHLRSDLVIAEGFKHSAAPKILVSGDAAIPDSVRNIIARVGAHDPASGIPSYTFEDLDGLAALIRREFLAGPTRPVAAIAQM